MLSMGCVSTGTSRSRERPAPTDRQLGHGRHARDEGASSDPSADQSQPHRVARVEADDEPRRYEAESIPDHDLDVLRSIQELSSVVALASRSRCPIPDATAQAS